MFNSDPFSRWIRLSHRRDFRLLWRWLTWRQRWMLLRKGYFKVIGHDGESYSLVESHDYNVMDAFGVIHCFLPSGRNVGPFRFGLPIYDQLLAQKLLLETSGLPAVAHRRQTAMIFSQEFYDQ